MSPRSARWHREVEDENNDEDRDASHEIPPDVGHNVPRLIMKKKERMRPVFNHGAVDVVKVESEEEGDDEDKNLELARPHSLADAKGTRSPSRNRAQAGPEFDHVAVGVVKVESDEDEVDDKWGQGANRNDTTKKTKRAQGKRQKEDDEKLYELPDYIENLEYRCEYLGIGYDPAYESDSDPDDPELLKKEAKVMRGTRKIVWHRKQEKKKEARRERYREMKVLLRKLKAAEERKKKRKEVEESGESENDSLLDGLSDV